MNTIQQVFQKQKQRGYGCLIGYITAGDPTPERTVEIADALIRGGVDILELGLPFSDPIADGPTIQNASLRALKAGTTPERVLEIAREIKGKHDIPIVIMTYYNPVYKYGVAEFLAKAKAAGVDGFIVPDLPVEEALYIEKQLKTRSLTRYFLLRQPPLRSASRKSLMHPRVFSIWFRASESLEPKLQLQTQPLN
jgi:tryptophan synthase alpha chain